MRSTADLQLEAREAIEAFGARHGESQREVGRRVVAANRALQRPSHTVAPPDVIVPLMAKLADMSFSIHLDPAVSPRVQRLYPEADVILRVLANGQQVAAVPARTKKARGRVYADPLERRLVPRSAAVEEALTLLLGEPIDEPLRVDLTLEGLGLA